jgi:hypothetical protein
VQDCKLLLYFNNFDVVAGGPDKKFEVDATADDTILWHYAVEDNF